MLSFLNSTDRKKDSDIFMSVTEGLKRVYQSKLLPLENAYHFHHFHSPILSDADFEAKPMILLVGQYSTGKTTFIKYLLEREFIGCRIGPEPTTDKFVIVMHGEQDAVIPGPSLIADKNRPFTQLEPFGTAFLNKLTCSLCPSQVLEQITLIDTPGILSGEKQHTDRKYNFEGVLEWFAQRVDLILLLFDSHKLDISDEFRRSIMSLRGYDDKIRIILNKADMVDNRQLMRIYGALMWNLGKVLNTPEVSRVYIGSFWDQPLRYDTNKQLFEAEANDLFNDIQSLPRNSTQRKVNDLIKRARLAKLHAYIMVTLKKEMPSVFYKESKKKDLIKNLGEIYEQVKRQFDYKDTDFPPLERMQEKLQTFDFEKLSSLKQPLIDKVNQMMKEDLTRLNRMVPQEQAVVHAASKQEVRGGVFEQVQESPFALGRGEGIDAGSMDTEWIVQKKKSKYDEIFTQLEPNSDGKLSGTKAKAEMQKSKLNNNILSKIWKLADVDKDGWLDSDEFALAMHLIAVKLDGYDLPNELPPHLVPPSKRPN